jgi:hypothetical protein
LEVTLSKKSSRRFSSSSISFSSNLKEPHDKWLDVPCYWVHAACAWRNASMQRSDMYTNYLSLDY